MGIRWLAKPRAVLPQEGDPISSWVDDGWDSLVKCVCLISNRWKESIALFNRLLPWAIPLDEASFYQPTQDTKFQESMTRNGGLEQEMPALVASGHLSDVCAAIAPDLFLYLRASARFD